MYTGASMSLDGFVAGPNETGFEHLFAWYGNGDIAVTTADPEITLQLTESNARHQQHLADQTGATVVGRKLYDATNAWGGQHPMGVPVVVLTNHPPESREGFQLVSAGIEEAVATAAELASDNVVGVNAGTIATQCYAAGLLDEVWIDLVARGPRRWAALVRSAGRPGHARRVPRDRRWHRRHAPPLRRAAAGLTLHAHRHRLPRVTRRDARRWIRTLGYLDDVAHLVDMRSRHAPCPPAAHGHSTRVRLVEGNPHHCLSLPAGHRMIDIPSPSRSDISALGRREETNSTTGAIDRVVEPPRSVAPPTFNDRITGISP